MLGESVVHWPAGVERNAETITAIVDRSQQVPDRANWEASNRRSLTKSRGLIVRPTVSVTEPTDKVAASVFVIDGVRWYAHAIRTNEDGFLDVEIQSTALGTSKPSRF